MKKRKVQRWIKRVSCRVGALLSICLFFSPMVIPAFASNNASTQKWYVADEAQLTSESGAVVRYLKLSPYVNGTEYTYTALSYPGASNITVRNATNSTFSGFLGWLVPINYPDWWRTPLPIGNLTYIDFRLVSFSRSTTLNGTYSPLSGGAYVYFFDSNNAVVSSYELSTDGVKDTTSGTTPILSSITLNGRSGMFLIEAPSGVYNDSLSSVYATSLFCNQGSDYRFSISNSANIIASPYYFPSEYTPVFGLTNLSNLSSDRFVIAIAGTTTQYYYKSEFKLSFWVDANKLPAGLEVGDEFPANDDAFDNLRDELLKQFPEVTENIENGKSTIQGWNDTETVDSDVASTSISALNAIFQNLGSFLFIVSLMIFGAVVLRMLVRKAVDG